MRSACLALCLLALGCGYRFTGGAAKLPDGIQAVKVPVFGNRTGEPSLEAIFTQAMRAQLDRAGVLGGDASPARLEGEILSVSSALVLVGDAKSHPPGMASAFQVSATVRLRLIKGDEVVRSAQVSGSEQYLTATSQDPLRTDANRQTALFKLAKRLAEDGYAQLAGD